MERTRVMFGLIALLLVVWSTVKFGVSPVEAARIADIRNTKHNLSASGPGTIKSGNAGETEVCVFCHTPHAATQFTSDGAGSPAGGAVKGPLWNRKIPDNSTYTKFYSSSSMDATNFDGKPGGSSKLCLSCHDGGVDIGQVNVFAGSSGKTFAVQNTAGGKMPDGAITGTGFTRNLGKDLSNDHPISATYDSTLRTNDGEMRAIDANQRVAGSNLNSLKAGATDAVGVRNVPSGVKTRPLLPLEKTASDGSGQVQCATCHDPHIKESSAVDHNIKFLRANRFQKANPSTTIPQGAASPAYDAQNDIICLACHDKAGAAWAVSVHANDTTANKAYKATAVAQREFLTNSSSRTFNVWEAACLNCHDTHTVPGARRLLREGVDSASTPKTSGNSAIEETCFQCHRPSTDANNILNLASQTVPDIYTDFSQGKNAGETRTYHMPIRSNEQCAQTEKHDIGDPTTVVLNRARKGKDFFEVSNLLGGTGAGSCDSGSNRHVECTDCHNPHRALKNPLASATTIGTQATHTHTNGTAHSNAASGALKGTFGVEITSWAGTAFGSIPTGFEERCGITGQTNACTNVVDKEYQICLKCHSNYAYTDVSYNNSSPTLAYNYTGRPPLSTDTTKYYTTPATYNQWSTLTNARYTNQGMEFQAPAGDRSEYNGGGVQANCYDTNPDITCNHRSWHPVMGSTGRTAAIRGSNASNWLGPFSAAVGSQTMYCTDCHGNATAAGTVVPSANKPWGPHGSTNPFILKGPWNTSTGTSNSDHLCFKCHSYNIYTAADGNGGTTGFKMGSRSNKSPGSDGHKVHRDKINGGGSNNTLRCNWCHVAVPHGWKNKAFLVNLNDVGPEVGLSPGTVKNGPYTQGPYYRNAMLKVSRFATSGNWADADCNGGADNMKNTCKNPP